MSAVFTFTDMREMDSAKELRALIGKRRVDRFGRQHPYGPGFLALSQRERGKQLAIDESNQLGLLKQDSDLLVQLRRDWEDHLDRLKHDIVSARDCESLRFELWVIRNVVLLSCQALKWRRYEPAMPDIQVWGPDHFMECKLIRNSSELKRIFDVLHNNREQHRGIELPYVIAVGFANQVENSAIAALPDFLASQVEWFRSHPGLSGLVVRTPARFRPKRRVMGDVVFTDFDQGSIASCLNWKADYPFPRGFRFSPPGAIEMTL